MTSENVEKLKAAEKAYPLFSRFCNQTIGNMWLLDGLNIRYNWYIGIAFRVERI